MGDYSGTSSELQVKWAEVRPRHGVAGGWVAVAVHLVALGVAALVGEEGDLLPVFVGFGAALVLCFAWLCVCWRVDPAETTWTTAQAPPRAADRRPSPIGVRAAVRHGWRPALVWLVAGTALLSAIRGLEGLATMILLAWFIVPVGALFGWLVWLLVVLPARYLAAGVGRLGGAGASPYPPPAEHPTTPRTPEEATEAMVRRHTTVEAPSPAVPMIGYSLLLLMVLPVSFALFASGAATSRYDAVPALIGYGGVEPTYPILLWLARAGLGVIVAVGIGLWWWLAREHRRIEHRKRGFGEL